MAKKEEEMKLLEKENARLQVKHDTALDEIQRLKDNLRSEVK